MNKTANEVLALTTETAEKLGMTDKLIETLNELLSPVITGGEPDGPALAEIKRRYRMIDGTLLQIELNIKDTLDSLSEIGGIAG